jgi:hypothetical protein
MMAVLAGKLAARRPNCAPIAGKSTLNRLGYHNATCGTIRLKLLKIGALVRVSVRRIKIAMASDCPAARDCGRAADRLAAAQARVLHT